MSAIRSAVARRVYDSRGHETVEVTIETGQGAVGTAGAPSGASTSAYEARAFPEGGVAVALEAFRTLVAPAVLGLEVADQAGFDSRLRSVDGRPDLSRIGGNTATAASIANARAHAAETGRALWEVLRRPGVTGEHFPAIVGNCLNGGRHAIGGPEIQEFLAVAPGAAPSETVPVALRVHAEVGAALRKRFPGGSLGRGDEGGWVAPVGNVEALEILRDACSKAADSLGREVHPGLDLAASEFYVDGTYRYRERTLDPEGQLAFLTELVDRYGIRYLEDPFDQQAYDSFAALTRAVGDRCLVVGDDLYSTRMDRLRRGLERRATNAILIKVNQVGTLTDTLATVDAARAGGLATVTSHRSGDLPDGWLAHLALATEARGLKCGLLGGERVAKLNELLRLGGPHRSSPE